MMALCPTGLTLDLEALLTPRDPRLPVVRARRAALGGMQRPEVGEDALPLPVP